MPNRPLIERVSRQNLEILQTALKAISAGSIGTLKTISFGSFESIQRSAQIKLYLERKCGSSILTVYWFADFEDKIECDLQAESLGYKDFSELLADKSVRFVEKIIIS